VVNNLARAVACKPRFKTPMLYKVVRHPILILGFIIAFWVAPTDDGRHLLSRR